MRIGRPSQSSGEFRTSGLQLQMRGEMMGDLKKEGSNGLGIDLAVLRRLKFRITFDDYLIQ